MKVWLNDLKEGDIFYHIILDSVHKCKHLGDAHNMNFKMSRIKFKVLDGDVLFDEDLLGDIHEAFVNQYVYDNYEEAQEDCINKIKDKLNNIKQSIIDYELIIENLELKEQILKDKLNKYDKCNIKEDIGKS